MAGRPWTDELLDEMPEVGDPPADGVVEETFGDRWVARDGEHVPLDIPQELAERWSSRSAAGVIS